MRFLFFYLMIDDPDRVHAAASRHVAYWHDRAPQGYLGGPFADRSGGLITFQADSPAEAEQLVDNDPFLRDRLLSRWWFEPWLVEPVVPTTSSTGRP